MPIFLTASVRRALGLGVAALAATLAFTFWLTASDSSTKKKKKAVAFCEPEGEPLEKQQEEADPQVEVEPVAMEVLFATRESAAIDSPASLEAVKDSACTPAMEDVDDHPASRSWADLMDEEEEEELDRQGVTLERSLSNHLPKSQPQLVPSSDSRKSNSSDSGVVSPAENLEDQQQKIKREVEQEKLKPQQQQQQQTYQQKQRVEYSRKSSSRSNTASNYNSNNTGVKHKKESNGKFSTNLPSCGSSDSGQGSEAGDGIRYTYHFHVPSDLTGKLIGHQGCNIDYLRTSTHCEISVLRPFEYEAAMNATYCSDVLRFTRQFIRKNLLFNQEVPPKSFDETQICVLEGSRQAIDRCIEFIREMFPLEAYPQFTLDQINRPKSVVLGNNSDPEAISPEQQSQQQLLLAQNMLHEVTVSAVVSAGHIFVQQPSHPSFASLSRLDVCMNNVYTKCPAPELSREEITTGLVCVAQVDEKWYRVQVVTYDAVTDSCDVKFLDFGGFLAVEVKDLRKIRSDFLKLPFQAIECYLANVVPVDSFEWTVEAGYILQELVTQENQILTCRMLGVAEDYVPMVHLYATDLESNTRLLNRDLVVAGGAAWVEHSAGVLPDAVLADEAVMAVGQVTIE